MRPTLMRTTAMLPGLLLAAVVTGCGTASPADDSAGDASAASWGRCAADDFARAGRSLGALGDGTGSPTPVRLVAPGEGPCAGGLVARSGAGVAGIDVSGLDLDATSAHVVRLRGSRGEGPPELLLVHGGDHPRGGFQPHLFTVYGGLHEVTDDGHPLLPFVATDGGGLPATARCGDHGTVEVLTATTSEPPGIVLAWDVQRTTYRIGESAVEEAGSDQIRDHTADPVLREEMPQLFEPDGFFADCRS